MKIESIIRRPKGTFVEMDAPKRSYHFKPEEPAGPHIADIDVEDHARALLRIRDGYRLVDGESVPPAVEAALEPVKLVGSVVHNASYVIHGETITLEQLVEIACEDSGLTPDEWNAQPDQERYAYIDATLKELQGETHSETLGPQSEDDTGDDAADEKADDADDTKESADDSAGDAAGDGAAPDTSTSQPLNTLPKRELMAMFEKKTGVKPSQKMTVADLVAAIEDSEDND